MKKKIIAHLSIILILSGVFCNVCNFNSRLSVYDRSFVFAEDSWQNVSQDDLVTAFRYYCKSRNLVIDGSVADALTSFTTQTFNNIVSVLGIDPTQLQAELKKTTDGNLGLRFLFSRNGVNFYNRIFAEFLQNNDIDVGDELDNQVIYSGEYYTDDDGNTCLVWELKTSSYNLSANQYGLPSEYFVKYGSYLKYSPDDYVTMINGGINSVSFHVDNSTVSVPIGISTYNQGESYCYNDNNYYSFRQYTIQGNLTKCIGGVGVAKITSWNNVVSGYALVIPSYNTAYYNFDNSNVDDTHYGFAVLKNFSDNPTGNTDVTVSTPAGTTINNNEYNNNWVIIYNDGDTYISDGDPEPSPTTPPDGGGGDNPDNPDFPPVDPTPTPDPTIPNWNIELPEMPEGNDWLLYGLEKKFPWDIPFNLMYMLSLFAADPETPHFEGTLDLKVVQWDYDIDLSPFDDIAGYFRNFEFIGFLLGLMLLTRKLIWG